MDYPSFGIKSDSERANERKTTVLPSFTHHIARPDSSFRRRTDGKTEKNGVIVEFECLLKL